MCKDMKKIPISPPNRLPNSPHPLKKSEKVYDSTGQRVNEFWGLLWVCLGLLWVRRVRKAEHLFNPLNPIFTYFSGVNWISMD